MSRALSARYSLIAQTKTTASACTIYDIDKSLVEKTILNEGDCYMIVNGGHCIKTLSDAQLFEFKNGPYYGPEKDKTEIS